MGNSKKIAIIGGIVVAIVIGVVMSLIQDDPQLEDKSPIEPIEGNPNVHDITPEIQERLENITKTVKENENTETSYEPSREREWITSGPFQIDRKEYALGESVFVRIGDIQPNEKGQIAFLRPLNQTHYSVYQTISFDGLDNNTFNRYFTPSLSKTQGICTTDEIVGKWQVVFRGTNYGNIEFTVTDKMIVPGKEKSYEAVC